MKRKGEVIQSGHFMISSVTDEHDENEDINHDRDSPVLHEERLQMKRQGYDFSYANKETKDTYHFTKASVTIDGSLSRLFTCMTLAYNGGRVVSPKWKNFKGLKLSVKDKIRLNNAIWRTWHIQYIKRHNLHKLIQFATPLENEGDYDNHSKPEAVVLEGKYWKRRIETVVAEYKKWRAFYTDNVKNEVMLDAHGYVFLSNTELQHSPSKDIEQMMIEQDYSNTMNDLTTDTLFSSLTGPLHFPDPREIAMRATNSDMIQPGLLQLQPSLDDFNDLQFESMHDWSMNPPAKKLALSVSGQHHHHHHSPSDDVCLNQNFAVEPSTFFTNPISQVGSQISPNLPPTHTDPLLSSLQCTSTHQPCTTFKQPISVASSVNSSMLNTPIKHQHQQVYSRPMHHQQDGGGFISSNLIMNHNQQQMNHSEPMMYTTFGDAPPQQMNQQQQQHHHRHSQQQHIQQHQQPIQVMQGGNVLVSYPGGQKQNNNNSMIFTSTVGGCGLQKHHSKQYIVDNNQQQQQQIAMQQQVVDNRLNIMRKSQSNNNSNQQQHHLIMNNLASAVGLNHQPQQQQQQTMTVISSSQQKQQPSNRNNQLNMDNDAKRIKQLLAGHNNRSNNVVVSSSSMEMRHPGGDLKRPRKHKQQQQQQNKNNVPTVETIPMNPSAVNKPPPPSHTWAPAASWTTPAAISANSTPTTYNSLTTVSVNELAVVSPDVTAGGGTSPLNSDKDSGGGSSKRRSGSFSAEQKRRFNIKVAFDRLQTMIPGIHTQPNAKISKASIMIKATGYIKLLQNDRVRMEEEIETLRSEVNLLKGSINDIQQQLPETGVPVTQPRNEDVTKKFNSWVKERSKRTWKFYLFGPVIRPWFESYHQVVSGAGNHTFAQYISQWADEKCSLPQLRSNVVNSLQVLSCNTSVLTNPLQLQMQVEDMVHGDDDLVT